MQPQQVFFKLRERKSHLLARNNTPVDIRKRDVEAMRMCSDTVNPGGEVRGCSVGCILGMPEVSHFVFIVEPSRYMGFLELNKCFFKRGCKAEG